MKRRRFFNVEMVFFTVITAIMLILLASVGSQFFENLKILTDHTAENESTFYSIISSLYVGVVVLLIAVFVIVYVSRYNYVKLKNLNAQNLTNLTIELASKNQCEEANEFYNVVLDYVYENGNYPCWEKGVYPNEDYVAKCIDENSLYVVRYNGDIVGAFILNENPEGDYSVGRWQQSLQEGQFLVIHTLAVHPSHQNQNISKYMVRYAIKSATENGYKSVRVDCTLLNAPAMHLYESLQFRSCGVFDLKRNVKGASRFQLYEYVIDEKDNQDFAKETNE